MHKGGLQAALIFFLHHETTDTRMDLARDRQTDMTPLVHLPVVHWIKARVIHARIR